MYMCLVWVNAGVFTPLVVTLIAGYFTVKNYVRNSLIRSGK